MGSRVQITEGFLARLWKIFRGKAIYGKTTVYVKPGTNNRKYRKY